MEIKTLSNGFVVFDNDEEVLQVKPELITSVRIFPPNFVVDKNSKWRVQISGDHIGWISFDAENREDADDIVKRVNEVL